MVALAMSKSIQPNSQNYLPDSFNKIDDQITSTPQFKESELSKKYQHQKHDLLYKKQVSTIWKEPSPIKVILIYLIFIM